MHKIQVRCAYIRPRWSAWERLHLVASVPREGTVNVFDLITLTYVSLTVLRWQASGSLQGETKLCQK